MPYSIGWFVVAVTLAAFQTSPEEFKTIDSARESFQNANALVAALQLSRGDWAADVGAGAGYYAMRMSEVAGPEGKIFAQDITESSIARLKARVKAFNLENVEVIKGDANDPKLPSGKLAAVLVVDTYHHFANHKEMLEKIFDSLKPGGRLVIADYSFAEHRALPRAEQLKSHEIDPELVQAEAAETGFKLARRDDNFVQWKPGVGNTRADPTDFWLLVMTRPK